MHRERWWQGGGGGGGGGGGVSSWGKKGNTGGGAWVGFGLALRRVIRRVCVRCGVGRVHVDHTPG